MKIQVFWDVTLRRLLNNNRPFEAVTFFHFVLELLHTDDDINLLAPEFYI
jgi:hypothetical protein